MALTQTVQIQIGSKTINFDNAYIIVREFHGTKTNMTFDVHWAEVVGGVHIQNKTYGCLVDLNGDNPIKQAYEYLKTLPEFANATDC